MAQFRVSQVIKDSIFTSENSVQLLDYYVQYSHLISEVVTIIITTTEIHQHDKMVYQDPYTFAQLVTKSSDAAYTIIFLQSLINYITTMIVFTTTTTTITTANINDFSYIN